MLKIGSFWTNILEAIYDTTMSSKSALRENIEKKGTNSYYHAHSHTANGPEWDGKEEPRLMASEALSRSSSSSRNCTSIKEYSWGDGKKLVTIYVDFEGAGSLGEDKLAVETTADTVTFTINEHNGRDYKLYIDKLSSEVESATIKVKDEQFKILLRKKEESPWFNLRKT